jgi:hypothetical protein
MSHAILSGRGELKGGGEMTLFVDSNFFLQCKKYDQLPWRNLTDQNRITILISSPVLKEIDKLKNDGNLRRSKRAREATALFRKMLNSSDFLQHITIKDIELTLSFAKNYTMAELTQVAEGLDINNPDDQILACVRNYICSSETDYQNCFFVSNDTNPLITAARNNIPAIEMPEDWLLPAENDEKDKEIIALKKQLDEFQNNIPQFSIDFLISKEKLISNNSNEYIVLAGDYKTLDDREINELVQEFLKKHPLQTKFWEKQSSLDKALHPLEKYYPPSEDVIKRYKDLYNKWETDIRDMISGYADIHSKTTNIIPFVLSIKNVGNVPAKELFVDFNVLAGGLLVRPDSQEEVEYLKRKSYPTPPRPPNGKWKSIFQSSLSAIAAAGFFPQHSDFSSSIVLPEILSLEKHDRYAFYWKSGKPRENVSMWRFECDEFRHKTDTKEFVYSLLFEQDADKLIFRVLISASNLFNPIEKIYILHKKSQQIDTRAEILHLLRHGVTEGIMKRIEGKKRAEYDK